MIQSVRQLARSHAHEMFMAMLPAIQNQVRIAFRDLWGEAREEAIQEAIANAFVAFVRLVQRGEAHKAFATVLARFAIAHVRAGRQVGSSLKARDVLSPYAQRKKRFVVERLERASCYEGQWSEAVVEDMRTPVADQAAFRVDFPVWLAQLPPRNRRLAMALAAGHTTGEVAQTFAISAARISQLRRELHDSWQRFHGEPSGSEVVAQAAYAPC